MAILSVNAGSSSLKFALYPKLEQTIQPVALTGSFQGLEPAGKPSLKYTFKGEVHARSLNTPSEDPFVHALKELKDLLLKIPDLPPIEAVAHRIVHGGAHYAQAVIASDVILQELSQLNSLAPLHQPHNLEGVKAFRSVFAHTPQVLCFDTAYHQTVGEMESAFALPKALSDQQIRRYGFHGLSYQFIMGTLQRHSHAAHKRVLMAHLGNGASLCAAQEGKSIATTMGFSALEGLMMGTRCGQLDPGVLLYLLEQNWSHDQLQEMLYKKSGLLGVSSVSADMRELRAHPSQQAQKAIDLFTHRIVRESGAMMACLGGLDVMAFSGGIGEHDAQLRADVCDKMAWLGLKMDKSLNAQATGDAVSKISSSESAVEIWVVPTDEGMVCAQEALHLLSPSA